eukprot:scaffold207203_cov17-Cyclotella_meneghiniana.AAC.1
MMPVNVLQFDRFCVWSCREIGRPCDISLNAGADDRLKQLHRLCLWMEQPGSGGCRMEGRMYCRGETSCMSFCLVCMSSGLLVWLCVV